MEHWRRVLPVPVLDVDYESTVADLRGAARRLIDWCGLRMGTGLPGLPRAAASRANSQREPGPQAGLPAFGRTLEELRRGIVRDVYSN